MPLTYGHTRDRHYGDISVIVYGGLGKKWEICFLCPQLEFPIIIPITKRPWHKRTFDTVSSYCLSQSPLGESYKRLFLKGTWPQ